MKWNFQKRRGLSAAIASVLMGVCALPVVAQDRMLEEVIVTTQRRAESLQTVPLAVSAFSGEELRAQGIFDIKGITERTPGFTMGEFNPGQTQLYIRGIGSNEDGAGGDQSVVVFIDEVYIGRAAGMDVDLFDLERVEVLRGPQGTLFGRNVVGGAVSLVTKKPDEETEIALEGTIGNYDAINLRGLASGQIAENVFGKVSFSSRRRDGYLDNQIGNFLDFFPTSSEALLADDNVRKINRDSLRGALRFTPRDDLEINLTANISTLDEDGAVRHYIEGPAPGVFAAHNALIPNYVGDVHAVLTDTVGRFENDIWGVTARVDWDINDSITFTSLTAFRDVDALNIEGGLGTENLTNLLLSTGQIPFGADGNNDYRDQSETFTQEFRFTSTGEGRLQWVGGLYFLSEDTDRTETATIGIKIPIGGGMFLDLPGFNANNNIASDMQNAKTDSWAIFGQATYDFTDQLSLTLGGRYSNDEKEISRVGIPNGVSIQQGYNLQDEEDWGEFTGKVSLNYQATDDVFIYGTWSEGYKSGGYQGLASGPAQAGTPFDPEFAELWELGVKMEFDRVRLNAAGFFTDYTDLQILQLLVPEGSPPGTPGVLITQNAADAEITGVEMEVTFAATDNLMLQGTFAYLDTEFVDFSAPSGFRPPDGGAGAGGSRIGNALRNAPEFAYSLMARYTQDLDSGGQISYQADFQHKDRVFQDPDVLDFASVPAYDLVNARITWVNADDTLEVAGWATNLFNEDYFIHNFPALGNGLATAGPPAMYGMTVTWRYR